MIVREQDGVKVILVDRLPPEVLGKIQALYARREESMEVHLDVIYAEQREAIKKILFDPNIRYLEPSAEEAIIVAIMGLMGANGASAASFMSKGYVSYGHASIGDCAVGCVLGIEGISILADKALQHWPLFSGTETSTRAVDFTHVEFVDPIGTPASHAVLERWMRLYRDGKEPVDAEIRQRYPRQENESEQAYADAVAMRSFDVRRGFLPAGIKTKTSMAMNLRQLADHLTWLLVHPLEEVRRVGKIIQEILRERYPSSGSFGGSATLSGIGTKGVSAEEAAARDDWHESVARNWTYADPGLRPGRANRPDALEWGEFSTTIDAGVLHLPNMKAVLQTRPRGCVLPRVFDNLGTCTASFLLDYGAWRDIERQRAGTCTVPLLMMEYGFESWYLNQLPHGDDGVSGLFRHVSEAIEQQEFEIETLTDDPLLRQYYIPLGYRVPTTLTYTLPIWIYVLELRTGQTVHPNLRQKMLWVVEQFDNTFCLTNNLGQHFSTAVPLHVDRRPDPWSMRRGGQTIKEVKV